MKNKKKSSGKVSYKKRPISFRLSDDLLDLAKNAAKRRGVIFSDYLRELIIDDTANVSIHRQFDLNRTVILPRGLVEQVMATARGVGKGVAEFIQEAIEISLPK